VTAVAALLPDGRLHLQNGPIDCLCRAWGDPKEINTSYAQAARYFVTVLDDLCAELSLLRQPMPAAEPTGHIARAMHAACAPFTQSFITPMAAVAGAVADAVLVAMTAGRTLPRAFVNNGGDIAFHLTPGFTLRCALVTDLSTQAEKIAADGTLLLTADHPARGVATSGRACKGRGGRSFSFGIADSVSVLARTAAQADAAATIIGNAVDLPGHPAIDRRPASEIDPASDLGDRLITYDVGPMTPNAIDIALNAGATIADTLMRDGLIEGAILTLRGRLRICHSSLELA
jgi:ApbE superfamily uncharacterized protein (UPF0280 family)